jgi:hypothetical protein
MTASSNSRSISPFVSKIERGERYIDVLLYLDWCRACSISPGKAASELEKAGG